MIRIAVAGAAGRMGREVVRTALSDPGMSLVAALDHHHCGDDVGVLIGAPTCGVQVEPMSAEALARSAPEVVVDFTVPRAAAGNALLALGAGARPIIGTTGLDETDLDSIRGALEGTSLAALVVPNFAIGAVLMMQFAARAARYMPGVEIVELHHDAKLDAPSGTARLTAERIAAVRERTAGVDEATEARGQEVAGIRIHSVRLPGLVAHQEVIFGAIGQTLTIRHDSIDRRSFMPGVTLAVQRISSLRGLHIGLEAVLDP
ncbi:MAG: 4-hydroxy-tetrahydrodipicolinate reductase [Chthonomonadales bacterium]|nr:4-hydroxy-tetrahydrodipicolinate reductase [Chthonomonadales bacterium]